MKYWTTEKFKAHTKDWKVERLMRGGRFFHYKFTSPDEKESFNVVNLPGQLIVYGTHGRSYAFADGKNDVFGELPVVMNYEACACFVEMLISDEISVCKSADIDSVFDILEELYGVKLAGGCILTEFEDLAEVFSTLKNIYHGGTEVLWADLADVLATVRNPKSLEGEYYPNAVGENVYEALINYLEKGDISLVAHVDFPNDFEFACQAIGKMAEQERYENNTLDYGQNTKVVCY